MHKMQFYLPSTFLKYLADSYSSFSRAICRAVFPTLFLMSVWAPASMRTLRQRRLPLRAAWCSAVCQPNKPHQTNFITKQNKTLSIQSNINNYPDPDYPDISIIWSFLSSPYFFHEYWLVAEMIRGTHTEIYSTSLSYFWAWKACVTLQIAFSKCKFSWFVTGSTCIFFAD